MKSSRQQLALLLLVVMAMALSIRSQLQQAGLQDIKQFFQVGQVNQGQSQDHDTTTTTDTNSTSTPNPNQHCFPWTANGTQVDDWWTDHPDWDIRSETDQGTCFAKITDERRAHYLRRIYDIQFGSQCNCSQALQSFQISSGFGASIAEVQKKFQSAIAQGKTYQMTKHWDGMRWIFAPPRKTSWAWCESTDMNCYLLPLSKCRPIVRQNDNIRPTPQSRNMNHNVTLWSRWYVGRYRHVVRRKVHELLRDDTFPPLPLPCTVLHVRRSDSGLARQPFRRYAALREYIETGNISAGDTVVLLTDDRSTIDEAQKFHPHIRWIYAQRPRHYAANGGFDGHVPSKDGALDLTMLLAELKYASRCAKLVHGDSGLVKQIQQELLHAGTQFTTHHVPTAVSKEEATRIRGKERGEHMLAEILQSNLAAAANRTP